MTGAMKFKVAAACRELRDLGVELGSWAPTSELTDDQGEALVNLIRSHTDLLSQVRAGLDFKRQKAAKKRRTPARRGAVKGIRK